MEDMATVVPGERLADAGEITAGDGTFKENDGIYSKVLGSVEFRRDDEVRVNPVTGRYSPKEGDMVIGEVTRVSFSNWTIDINAPYDGRLHINDAVEEYVDLDQDDISQWFDMGDLVATKITKVTKGKEINLSMESNNARKLEGGRVVEVPPSAVSRVIGRRGTMVNMIKDNTGTKIIIGQNGLIWVKGRDERLAARAIKKVAREAHTEGLTERMEAWFNERGDN